MPLIRVDAFTSGDSTSTSSYSNNYGTLQILQAIGAVVVVLLGAASVILGLLSLTLCNFPFFFFFFHYLKHLIDFWLVVHGVTVLGALVGLVVWRTKMAHGKIINGPKILAILLIIINFLWLIWGNVLLGITFFNCPFLCGFGYVIFFLVIVLLFDVFYIIFFVTLCVFGAKGQKMVFLDEDVPSSDSCCVLPYCLTCLYPFPHRASWQEWVAVTCLVIYVTLGLSSVVMGSVFLLPCGSINFIPVWNIVNGLFTILTVCVLLCCFGFPKWVSLSWERPSALVFTPLIGLVVFLVVWLVVGNVVVLRDPLAGCTMDSTCNSGLLIYTSVVVYLLDLTAFVLIYVAVIFLILMLFLFTITSCAQYCGKPLKRESPSESSNTTVEEVDAVSEDINTSG